MRHFGARENPADWLGSKAFEKPSDHQYQDITPELLAQLEHEQPVTVSKPPTTFGVDRLPMEALPELQRQQRAAQKEPEMPENVPEAVAEVPAVARKVPAPRKPAPPPKPVIRTRTVTKTVVRVRRVAKRPEEMSLAELEAADRELTRRRILASGIGAGIAREALLELFEKFRPTG